MMSVPLAQTRIRWRRSARSPHAPGPGWHRATGRPPRAERSSRRFRSTEGGLCFHRTVAVTCPLSISFGSSGVVLRQCCRQALHECADLVAHPAVVRHRLVLRGGVRREPGRIVKWRVNGACAWNRRARLVCGVADRDDDIEVQSDVLGALWPVLRDVHAALRHRADGPCVERLRVRASGVRLDATREQCAHPALSHLAAAGVACAQEEHARNGVRRCGTRDGVRHLRIRMHRFSTGHSGPQSVMRSCATARTARSNTRDRAVCGRGARNAPSMTWCVQPCAHREGLRGQGPEGGATRPRGPPSSTPRSRRRRTPVRT